MMRSLRALASAGCLLLVGCAANQPQSTVTTQQGGDVMGEIVTGGHHVPLPPGRWTIAHNQTEVLGSNSSQLFLVSTTEGTIDRMVTILRRTNPARDGFPPHALCSYPQYHAMTTAVNTRSHQECRHVRGVNYGLAGSPHPVNRILFDYAGTHKLFFPATMVGPRYHFADTAEMIEIEYLWNVDVLLPADTKAGVWVYPDWTKAAAEKDPRKTAIITELTRWGSEWLAKVKASL